MWATAKTQPRLGAAFVVLVVLVIVAAAFAEAVLPEAQPDVLIVQHGYDGEIEKAGTLVRWQYTGGHMLIEWVDIATDGIYRSGFE